MGIAAIVVNGIVENLVVVSQDIPEGAISCDSSVEIGDLHDGVIFTKAPAPILTDDEKAVRERSWRDAELFRADIEINKSEDALGAFDAETWRAYRQALRDWPADPNFPDSDFRPSAPDA